MGRFEKHAWVGSEAASWLLWPSSKLALSPQVHVFLFESVHPADTLLHYLRLQMVLLKLSLPVLSSMQGDQEGERLR